MQICASYSRSDCLWQIAEKTIENGIGMGLVIGCKVFVLVLLKGNVLTAIFTTDETVIMNGYDYLKGFAPETIVTAILFSMVGYFNGHDKTLWVMIQGLAQTLLVRLPLAYYMSILPDTNLTKIGLAAPVATVLQMCRLIRKFCYRCVGLSESFITDAS